MSAGRGINVYLRLSATIVANDDRELAQKGCAVRGQDDQRLKWSDPALIEIGERQRLVDGDVGFDVDLRGLKYRSEVLSSHYRNSTTPPSSVACFASNPGPTNGTQSPFSFGHSCRHMSPRPAKRRIARLMMGASGSSRW